MAVILRKVLLPLVEPLNAAVCSCGSIVQKVRSCKDALPPVADSLATFGKASTEINTFKRDFIKHRIPI